LKDQALIKPRNSELASSKQKFNRKASIFAVCLVIAGFFWVVTTLSLSFSSSIKFPVKYINLPKDKVISNTLPDSLELDIKARGFDILSYRLKNHMEPVVVDASTYKPHKGSDYYYLTTNTKIENIARQVGQGIKILSIIPDTIFLNFSKKVSKVVPVHTRLSLGFKKEFEQSDSAIVFPKEIRISGSPALVEKVKELQTEDLVVSSIDKTVTFRKALVIGAELKQLEFSADSVSIKIPVSKFTEGLAEVPLQFLNVPPGVSLKVFPDKVNITYLVAFDSFEKIKPDMFRAVVDYLKLEPGSSKIRVELVRSPANIRSISVNPDRVEYIVRK
jgi:hypothetical protein